MTWTSNHIAGDDDWDVRLLVKLHDFHAGTIDIDDRPLPAVNMDMIDALLNTIDAPLPYHEDGKFEGAAAEVGDAP